MVESPWKSGLLLSDYESDACNDKRVEGCSDAKGMEGLSNSMFCFYADIKQVV